MSNLFRGMEEFGLSQLSSDLEVFESKTEEQKQNESDSPVVQEVLEEDVLFDKTMECPVCDKSFKVKTIKTGKVKLLSADTDLRPKYQTVDSLKYDAVVCPHCGYAALRRFFPNVTSGQVKLIKENISANFKGINQEMELLSYDDAISRHKLALVNTIVKKGKNSERAYICLKLAWLIRGKRETLPNDTKDYNEVISTLKSEECEFLSNAFEGFKDAFSKEGFPMCGMDEITCTYLVGDLARRTGKFDEASRWVSKVLIARNANERIKEKARDIKEMIMQGKTD